MRSGLRFYKSAVRLQRVAKVVRAELCIQRALLCLQRGEIGLGGAFARRQLVPFALRAFQCGNLCLQRGNAAGFVIFAGVELLFQRGKRLGAGAPFLAGGDQRGNAAFKFRVLIDDQAVLADKRATLKDPAGYAKQLLAAGGGAQPLNGFAAAGVNGGKAPHRAAGTRGIALKGNVAHAAGKLQYAAHRRERPWRVAVLVGKRAALARRQTVEHRAQKRKHCRFSGLVRSLNDVQPFGECKRAVIQFSKRRIQTAEFHVQYPFSCSIEIALSL